MKGVRRTPIRRRPTYFQSVNSIDPNSIYLFFNSFFLGFLLLQVNRPSVAAMMHNFTIKFLIVIVLVWFRLINQHMGVNCNLNRLHNLLMRNSHPCAVNSLCMCTNNGNGTYTYKISCHEVWFYKFTGKMILFFVFRWGFHRDFVSSMCLVIRSRSINAKQYPKNDNIHVGEYQIFIQ